MGYIGKVPADVLIDPMVDSAAITDATIVTADLANDAVTSAKLAADSVDSSELVNGSVDNAHLAGSIAMNKTNLTAGTGLTLSTDTLSVDAAQTQITSVGTIGTGVWNGTAIASAYLDADTAHLSGSTFTGSVQISHGTTPDFTLNDTGGTTNKRVFRIAGGGDAVYFEGRNNDNSGDGSAGLIQTLSLSDASVTFAGDVVIDSDTKGLVLGDDQDVTLYSDSVGKVNIVRGTDITPSSGDSEGWMELVIGDNSASSIKIVGGEGGGTGLYLYEDGGDDNNDHWAITTGSSSFKIDNYSTGSWVSNLAIASDGTMTFAGDLKFGNNPTSFYMDTSDGNDDKKLQMCGGGGVGTDRGATIIMYGNEIANNEGCLDLKAGWKSDEGDIRFFTGNNDERGRINYAGGLGVKGAFVNSASSDPADYQISFGGDAVTTPRWGFRVSGSSNEDLYLDRNLSGTPAIAMAWNKANGNTTIKGKLTIEVENETPLHIKNTSTAGGNNAYLTIENDGGADTYLNFLQGSSNGYIKYTDEGDMIFQTAGMNDRLKLDSDMALFNSHVNIGSDSTTQWEHTSGSGSFHYHKGDVDSRNAGISMSTDSSVGYAMFYLNMIDGANDERVFAFYRNDSQIGAVRLHGTTEVTYDTTSDYRLKENIEPMTGSIARLKQIKPSTFNFISEPDRSCEGFIAHELAGIVPNAVSGEKDAMRDDGKRISPQGVDSGKVVPLLVSALQEAIERIEVLENA